MAKVSAYVGVQCSVEDCTTPARCKASGKGPYCAMHAQRVWRYGDPNLLYDKNRNRKPPQEFIAGICQCGELFCKPRIRVKAISRPIICEAA